MSFTRMLALSLKAASPEGVEVGFLSKSEAAQNWGIETWPIKPPRAWPGENTLRRLAGQPPKTAVAASLREHQVDVALPFLDLRRPIPGTATIGWIPDFQAARLPQYFDQSEKQHHDRMVENLTRNATTLLLSSNDALSHLAEVAPRAVENARAIPFPSLFAFDPLPPEIGNTVARYHLPEKFALLSNQVWRHKNHAVVIEALRQAKASGVTIPLVCTGLPLDHRDPANRPTSDLLQAIAQAGLHASVHVLGAVPFSDLVDLMRSAAVVIQPSRFEGWSTVVQDALALGRPVICSKIGVHLEQAPEAAGYFGVDAPGELATRLLELWPQLEQGPDYAKETESLRRERAFARQHGEKLIEWCREAINRK